MPTRYVSAQGQEPRIDGTAVETAQVIWIPVEDPVPEDASKNGIYFDFASQSASF
jgi:hypothetical protein